MWGFVIEQACECVQSLLHNNPVSPGPASKITTSSNYSSTLIWIAVLLTSVVTYSSMLHISSLASINAQCLTATVSKQGNMIHTKRILLQNITAAGLLNNIRAWLLNNGYVPAYPLNWFAHTPISNTFICCNCTISFHSYCQLTQQPSRWVKRLAHCYS